MIALDLRDWYISHGVNEEEFCVGPEHPAMENLAITILDKLPTKRVLEIGYQSGGFGIPIISHFAGSSEFHYTGIDNLEFHNNRQGGWHLSHLGLYLDEMKVPKSSYIFHQGDAYDFLSKCTEKFDLILIDHLKALYERELKTILKKKVIQPHGYILLHDVNKRAKSAWNDCKKWCHCFNSTWKVYDEVASGLAVVGSDSGYRSKGQLIEKYLEIRSFTKNKCKKMMSIIRTL